MGNDSNQAALAEKVATLRDEQAIRDHILRYADAVDRRDWDVLDATFTSDAVVAGLMGERPIGPYLEFLKSSVAAYDRTMHVFSNQLVDLEPGADTATATTYAVAYHMEAPDTGKEDLVVALVYFDALTRQGDGWAVSQRRTESKWIKGPLPSSD